VIGSEISKSMGAEGIWEKGAAAGSDAWLARFFLFSILGAGLASSLFGLSPESIALLPCPIHSISGVECPGCGMTRACIALCRGDISHAVQYNPLSIGLVLLAAGFALAADRMRRNWARLTPGIRQITKWTALIAVLVFWVCRNLP